MLTKLEILSHSQSLVGFRCCSESILTLLSLSKFVYFPKENFEPAQTHTNKVTNKTQYKGTETDWLN